MSAPDPYLSELADLAMDLARDVHRRAKQTKSDADAVQLTLAFERLSRSVRLNRMLEDRLQDQRRIRARNDHAKLLDHRKAQLKSAIGLAIDEQHGLAQAVRLRQQLSERLEHDRLFDILAVGAVEQHIARLSERLGLDLPREEPTAERASAPPPNPLVPAKAGTKAEPQPAPGDPVLAPCEPP